MPVPYIPQGSSYLESLDYSFVPLREWPLKYGPYQLYLELFRNAKPQPHPRPTETLGVGPLCSLTSFPGDPILCKVREQQDLSHPFPVFDSHTEIHLGTFVDFEFSSLKELLHCHCQFLIIIPLLHSASSHHHINTLSRSPLPLPPSLLSLHCPSLIHLAVLWANNESK